MPERWARRTAAALALPAAALLISGAATWALPGWPEWRGAGRAGVTAEPSGWDGRNWQLRKLWQVDIGPGLGASPIISGGRVYVMGRRGSADAVWCLDAATGAAVWRQDYQARLEGRYQRGESPEGPTCTPTLDPQTGLLYTRGNDGDLHCWDARAGHGRAVWHTNLYDSLRVPARLSANKTEPFRDYGFTSNVLIYGDWALIEAGSPTHGNIVAFDKRTGRRVWGSQDRHAAGHSCGPVLLTVEGVPCLASLTLEGLCVMRLDRGHEGRTVAFHAWTAPFNVSIPTPCVVGQTIVITGTDQYNSGLKTTFVEVTLAGVKRTWLGERQSYVCSPVAHRGSVYGVDGRLWCLEAATGRLRWEGGRFAGDAGSVVVAGDGKVIAWGTQRLVLAEGAGASPRAYRELAAIERPIAGGRGECYPHAALGEGKLLVRDGAGQLACYAVGAPQARRERSGGSPGQ